MKKNLKTLIGIVLGIYAVLTPMTGNRMVAVDALSPMPTAINTTNLTDSQVNSYYAGVSGLSGDPLVAALYDIIKGHNEYDYESSTHRTILKIVDRNWALSPLTSGELSSFNYDTDNPYIKKLYGDYNDNIGTADFFFNPGASRVSFDKEHIWAQSLGEFGRKYGAGSDWYALWPSDIVGNQNAHSNYNFAVPTSGITNYDGDKGTYVGRNGYMSGGSLKVFEPLDQYKGDIARAMFYMPARYYVYVDAYHPKLQLVNGTPAALTASPTQPGLAGDLATLLEWNKLDPVDDYEIKRNNLLYNNYQGNRNPFIDHPEWADIAYDTSYAGSGATIASETSSVGTNPAWQTNSAVLTNISVNYSSAKTNYALNEAFSTTGLVVTAHYDDASSQIVSSYTTSPTHGTSLTTPGSNTITVSYTENEVTQTTTYAVTVSESTKTLVSLSLNTTSVQTTFVFKETFNHDNLVVTAHYSDSSSETITTYNISTPSTTVLGSQSVSVTYQDKSSSYQVTVTNQGSAIGVEYASDLFISEYIEGSSYNKAIEIYNGTNASVDLSSYSLRLYSNGASLATATVNLSGTISHNDVYVISRTDAGASIQSVTDLFSNTVINHNGDDSYALFKNETLIDCFGQIGVDPGTAWISGSVTTVDKTLVRKPSVRQGDATSDNAFDPALEWDAFAIDTFSYLGGHTMDMVGTAYIDQAVAYGDFFLEETSGYCQVLDGGNVNWTLLSNEYGYMIDDAKDYFVAETTTDEAVVGAIERYTYLVNKYANLAIDKFVKDSNGVSLLAAPTIVIDESLDNLYWFLFALITFLSSYIVYISLKKRVKRIG